jgi:predicted enzyme related to lactoylglutathione lyase
VLPPLNEPSSDQQLTGKFIWYELATVDVAKQKQFYADVFGWSFSTINKKDDQYTLIKNNGRNIAGLFSVKPREDVNIGALWIGLMSVNDPDKTTSIIKSAGGSVHTQPTRLPQRGTYALVRDPEGAIFGVLKSDSGDPVDSQADIGDFIWMDLFASDIKSSGEFYRQLVGYSIETREPHKGVKRLILHSVGMPRAGIVPLPENANRSGWLPYIKVNDVAATLKKVEAAGGYIMVAPDKSLLNGNLAIFADPQGGILGIVKWEQP